MANNNLISEFVPVKRDTALGDQLEELYAIAFSDQMPNNLSSEHFALVESGGLMRNILAGASVFYNGPTRATLDYIAVQPNLQRQGYGLGRKLLTHIEDRLYQEGVRKLELTSSQDSIAFYEKLGYSSASAIKRNEMYKALPQPMHTVV